MITTEEYKERARRAIERGIAKNGGEDYGLGKYPVDVVDIIRKVCDKWGFRPPTSKKRKGYVIASARELEDACAEFGPDLLDDVHQDWKDSIRLKIKRGLPGTAPYIVSDPGSLIKMASAKAGEKRVELMSVVTEREKRAEGFCEKCAVYGCEGECSDD